MSQASRVANRQEPPLSLDDSVFGVEVALVNGDLGQALRKGVYALVSLDGFRAVRAELAGEALTPDELAKDRKIAEAVAKVKPVAEAWLAALAGRDLGEGTMERLERATASPKVISCLQLIADAFPDAKNEREALAQLYGAFKELASSRGSNGKA